MIGRNFIEVFQETAHKVKEAATDSPRAGDIEWLLQGTLYPDVIESIAFRGNISHDLVTMGSFGLAPTLD